MADRYPLVVDSSNQNIKELPDGDSLLLGDSEKLRFGDGQDLNIYHDGSHSIIEDTGTGNLVIRSNLINFQNASGSESLAKFTENSSVQLYHNDAIKLTTASGGVNITGVATASQSANITQVAITSNSASVAWDAAAAANAYHVTTENTTIANPTNQVEGAIISVEIAQGGTARTIAWGGDFEFAASTAPTVTATANKTDIFAFRYNGAKWQEIGRVQNLAQS